MNFAELEIQDWNQLEKKVEGEVEMNNHIIQELGEFDVKAKVEAEAEKDTMKSSKDYSDVGNQAKISPNKQRPKPDKSNV